MALYLAIYQTQSKDSRWVLQKKHFNKNVVPHFSRLGLTILRLQRNYGNRVDFLPLSLRKYLVLISSTLEGRKVASTLKPPCSFEPETHRLAMQPLSHYTIALASDPKVVGSNLNYILCQDFGPKLNPRVWMTIGSCKIKCSH